MGSELWTLSRRAKAPQVLVIDDFIPGTRHEARMPRAAALLGSLAAAGAQVTVLPTLDPMMENTGGYRALRLKAGDDLGRVLATRIGTFAAIVVARPRNLAMLAELIEHSRAVIAGAVIVYDAELSPVPSELACAQQADVVLALDAVTAAPFEAHGHPDVRVLGHAVTLPASPPFGRRSGFLAIGPTYGDPVAINAAAAWFSAQVMPRLHARLGRSATLTIMGDPPTGAAISQASETDPGAALALARVLVVPREAGEGLPINILEAAAQGLPAVVTPAQARRFGWTHGREVLVAGTAHEFAAACSVLHADQLLWEGISAAARTRAAAGCGHFDAVIRDVLALAVGRRQ